LRSADLRQSSRRLRVAGAAMVVAFSLLAVRAANLSLVDPRGGGRGGDQAGKVVRIAPARGLVVDRLGSELAVTLSAPSVYAMPRAVSDAEAMARSLAGVLRSDARELQRRLEHDSSFAFLRRWVTPEQARAVEALELSGVGIVYEPRRVYPQEQLAGQILGFANIDGIGARGVEQQEDAWLRGRAQAVAVERDARGRLLAGAGHDPRSAVGGDVALTLDAALQAETESALDEILEATGAANGLVVSLDVRSGDLLAVAERPGFDPNLFRATPYGATRSRAFLDAVEPGSSLKQFVIAAALEQGALALDAPIDCENGHWRVPGKTLRDVKPHGILDPAGVLRVSSNIGAAKIGYMLGASPHFERLRAFGFGSPSGSGFPDESAGLLRHWRDWRPVDHANISFGQGISVTPVQLAAATAAIARGGVWLPPRLVAARREAGGLWQAVPPGAERRVLRREVADAVLAMMEGVVGPEGTGRFAALRDLRVAGKTGTAQKLDPETGTYSQKRYLAWFVGVVPADDPRLVVVVMLDEPKGRIHTGGATAAPLFARAAASALARQGILTDPERELPWFARVDGQPPWALPAAADPSPPPPGPAPAAPVPPAPQTPAAPALASAASPALLRLGDRVLLPDFRGLTADQVRQITAGAPFRLEIHGVGRAVAQDPAPGSVVAGGSGLVRVRFEPRGAGG
jgi:cell division protein FtsI (penicillin-binding protein 3)